MSDSVRAQCYYIREYSATTAGLCIRNNISGVYIWSHSPKRGGLRRTSPPSSIKQGGPALLMLSGFYFRLMHTCILCCFSLGLDTPQSVLVHPFRTTRLATCPNKNGKIIYLLHFQFVFHVTKASIDTCKLVYTLLIFIRYMDFVVLKSNVDKSFAWWENLLLSLNRVKSFAVCRYHINAGQIVVI